ncbi:MAG: hypothetical protein LCH30_04230, partial [Proteobacteria bacterium]|nr:hypothetical protein [Pseudomonadota bacterium]
GEDEDYLNLKTSLVKIILEKILSDYRFYSTEFQDELANTEGSHELLKIVSIIDFKDKASKDKVAGARQTFLDELKKLKIELPVIEKSRKLAMYMPFLKDNQKNDIDAIAVDKDLKAYITTLIKNNFDAIFDKQEENLNKFNQTIISELAGIIYKAFDNSDKLNYDEFFINYQKGLIQFLNEKYFFIRKSQEKANESASEMEHSLAYLFNYTRDQAKKAKQFLDKMSDAHAFIQSVGGGSQGDNFFLGLVDIYNSGRYADEVGKTKETVLNLLAPFKPLLDEYKLTAYEKNLFLKIIKSLFPILVVATLVILTSLLLAPLALPELVLAIIIIPTLIISVIIAAQVVRAKNAVFDFAYKNIIHNGPFSIPEFLVNERMTLAFKNDAENVRQFYIDEIEASIQLENDLQIKLEAGVLTEKELQEKIENLKKRDTLYLEWYDIHSNLELGYDKVRLIVSKRLADKNEQEGIKLDAENKTLITTFSGEAARKLTHQFKNPAALNFQPHLNFFKPIENASLKERMVLQGILAKAPSP